MYEKKPKIKGSLKFSQMFTQALHISRLSMDQIADRANIVNKSGEVSPNKLYLFRDGRMAPTPTELRNIIRVLNEAGDRKSIQMIADWFFGDILSFSFAESGDTNGYLEDDIIRMTANLGTISKEFLNAIEDSEIDKTEAIKILNAINNLQYTLQTAKKELINILEENHGSNNIH